MTAADSARPAGSLFRIDRFEVPAQAMPPFIERLHRTQQVLDTMPGCRQNLVLRQEGGAGGYNFITLVEWIDEEALAAAKAAMRAKYDEEGFDPGAFMRELQVKADMGVYFSA